MADAFVSYAREDLILVRQLTEAPRARNREIWIDPHPVASVHSRPAIRPTLQIQVIHQTPIVSHHVQAWSLPLRG